MTAITDTREEMVSALVPLLWHCRTENDTPLILTGSLLQRGFTAREIDDHIDAALLEARRRVVAAQGAGL